MSKPFNGPTWDDVLAILEQWEQGHGSPPEGWPAWCGNGDTGRHGRRGQSPSGSAASLAAQLGVPIATEKKTTIFTGTGSCIPDLMVH